MNATWTALLICVAAFGLEGMLAGGGVQERFAELRLPRGSPPLAVWAAIGLFYYAICFWVLRCLLAGSFSATGESAFVLLIAILLANAFWNALFFRRRNLRASVLFFWPYTAMVVALVVMLVFAYPLGAALFGGYALYLCYAIWLMHRIWQLNR